MTGATHPIRRSGDDRFAGGVCAGLARAVGIDPLVVRLGFVIAATVGGFGVVAYLLLWIALPADDGRRGRVTSVRVSTVETVAGGAMLVAAAALALAELGDEGAAVLASAVGGVVVAAVLAAALVPFAVRLVRSLASERDARVRSQERAELAAHLHDSVLQTLALVQQRADDPRAVAALARRQERELRSWLAGGSGTADVSQLRGALEAVATEVETDHGVRVDVVVVGDAALDDRGRALVAAAREAVVNAAKFGGGDPVSVYAEAGEGLSVFVRDRGPGFPVDAVPEDRRGVRESIIGRMERHGGRALLHRAPGGGTEVELVLP